MELRHVGRCCVCGEPASFLDVEQRGLLCEEHQPKPTTGPMITGTATDQDGQMLIADFYPDDVAIYQERRPRKKTARPATGGVRLPGFDS